ncbi:MAG: hypothetical protein CCU26_08505 [Nitrospira sp. UW-LDO-01]|nr:MAG: hypothetical protein CCU26_08505 [Nitrospira sp. UW-LDO-01]
MDRRLRHAPHRTDVVMDSAQKSQAAGQIVLPPLAAPSPHDMTKPSKRGEDPIVFQIHFATGV